MMIPALTEREIVCTKADMPSETEQPSNPVMLAQLLVLTSANAEVKDPLITAEK